MIQIVRHVIVGSWTDTQKPMGKSRWEIHRDRASLQKFIAGFITGLLRINDY